MATAIILIQLALVMALIFIGARVGGIGLGIYGMVGVFILVFVFGLKPGNLPIDVMLIIVSVITAASTLQAAGGLDYLVGVAARFLRKHPEKITYYGPLTTWLFCLVAGTAHTSYSLLPIISEIATNSKISTERPLLRYSGRPGIGSNGSHHQYRLTGLQGSRAGYHTPGLYSCFLHRHPGGSLGAEPRRKRIGRRPYI